MKTILTIHRLDHLFLAVILGELETYCDVLCAYSAVFTLYLLDSSLAINVHQHWLVHAHANFTQQLTKI